MVYLKAFSLVSQGAEDNFILSYPHQLEMQCYSNSAYPFKIFPSKHLSELEFDRITVLCGSNGSGKSTLLNVIAGKLGLLHSAPFNDAPCFDEYLKGCSFTCTAEDGIPKGSEIIKSDDVFDFLLDIRSVNREIEKKRERLFNEYDRRREERFTLSSLEDLDTLKEYTSAWKKTRSAFTSERLQRDVCLRSNGESAFLYFTQRIKENALYLLDEPENSLSPMLQKDLAKFLSDSARFFGCQFIISTHSPFILSLPGAKIYDLDSSPADVKDWTKVKSVSLYKELLKH